jgi:[acyl-carrier-protein] S-malonyltransferase
MTARRKAVVICPGRGTYNKTELGYLHRFHADKSDLITTFDAERARLGQAGVWELDGSASYTLSTFSRGDNAAPLIFACSYADYLSLNRAALDVVAVTGNSMGWYTALACGGALDAAHGFAVANAMGVNTMTGIEGGQVIYTLMDEDWQPIPGRMRALQDIMDSLNARMGPSLYVSIRLGGMVVLAGNETALDALMKEAPVGPGRFPMKLQNHGPFHTPLMTPASERALSTLPVDWFAMPRLPLVDGRGHIWRPFATDREALWDYTLRTQVVEPYDFTRAVQVAVKEFAPDCLIILGPGDTMGGAVAQSLIDIRWRGLDSKAAFAALQASSPFVLAMGREDQRDLAIQGAIEHV